MSVCWWSGLHLLIKLIMNSQKRQQQKRNLYSAACGICSFCATLVTNVMHPFELIKTRLQSHDGRKVMNLVPKYKGVTGAIHVIYKTEGLAGLYKGVQFSFISQMAAHSLFFMVYERRLVHYKKARNLEHMNAVFYASIQGALAASTFSQPLWVIRTWMLLNTDAKVTEFQNFTKSATEIYKQSGLKGYMRGLTLSIILCSNVMIQMFVYEMSKNLYRRWRVTDGRFGEQAFICGGLGKFTSVLVTYPLSTVRTRVQQNQYVEPGAGPKYNNAVEIISKIWKQQGIKGYYKGIWANIMKGLPQRGLYFYFYELFKKLLRVDLLKH